MEQTRVVPIERVTILSERPFDDVVAAVYAGLGRDFAGLQRSLAAATGRDQFDALTGGVAGSSGLIEFLSLDLGGPLAVRYPDRNYRMLRIIAGNPVTMSTMAVTVPDVGSYAPVTILIAERPDGVHVCYDRVSSAIGPYENAEASAVAHDLDDAVLALLRDATGG